MIIENTVMHHFYDKKAHKGSYFRQIKKKKKNILEEFLFFFSKIRIFLKNFAVSFWQLKSSNFM